MKKPLIAIAVAVLAAATACVAADFPYYPEYAEEFAKVEEVTPLLAKKVVMTHPFICPAGAIVCEPLVLRDIVGKPTWISINAYAGDDLSLVDRYNRIVRRLNAGERIDASELEQDLSYFRGSWEFTWVILGAYTIHSLGFPAASYGALPVLSGFRPALAFAREELGSDDLYFNRIAGTGFSQWQGFEFEAPTGEKVMVEYEACGGDVHLLDIEEYKAGSRETAKTEVSIIESFEASGRFEERLRAWAAIDAGIPDEVAADDYARIPPDEGEE